MATNEFLPFAAAGGANVLSQADWLALAARLSGFTAGVASSQQLNKAWRQSAAVAAAFGQFLNDYGGLDALDDANTANLVRDFARSLQAGKFSYAVATGSANAWTVAPTPAVAAYAAGRALNIIAPATNTSTTVNMNVSTLGNRRIKKADGSDPAIGDLVAGRIYATIDDGTNIRVLTPLASDMQSAVSTMPIFPEVDGAGTIAITAGSGNVVVDPGQGWVWRGIRAFSASDFSSGDRTFATAANKTYHLRWHAPGTGTATPAATYPNGRFELADMTSAIPVETDASYDTTYDRMLIARIVTNGSNVPATTPLINKHRLRLRYLSNDTRFTRTTSGAGLFVVPFAAVSMNWARTPAVTGSVARMFYSGTLGAIPEEASLLLTGGPVSDSSGSATPSVNRYAIAPVGVCDLNLFNTPGTLGYDLSLIADA